MGTVGQVPTQQHAVATDISTQVIYYTYAKYSSKYKVPKKEIVMEFFGGNIKPCCKKISFNPWQVDSIQEFYVLKCPECTFIHQEESSFQEHAVENHPLSAVFFGKKTEEGSFKKPTNEKKRKISTVDNKGCSIESKPRKKPKIDDCNQKNESNDVLIPIKEEIS